MESQVGQLEMEVIPYWQIEIAREPLHLARPTAEVGGPIEEQLGAEQQRLIVPHSIELVEVAT